MTIDRNAHPHSVSNLLKTVDAAELALPEFQRDFIWKPGDVVKLLQTVARQWPCGTFLLQEGPQPFASKPINRAPALNAQPKLLVLDGQQRLTALYHAIREKGQETYFVDIGKLRESEVLDDDHVRYMKSDRYHARYPSLQSESAAEVVRVSTLTKDSEFFNWANLLDEPTRSAAIRLRDEQLGGFKHYSVPCVVLDADLPLAAVARIFETLNRTGVKLDTFDLMVAKLYPFNFRLRDEWASAKERFALTLGRFEVDGIEILKTIALREHIRQSSLAAPRITVKGVRESDVIALEPRSVKDSWTEALSAYHSALLFLRDECGVISPALLPATATVLPIANLISHPASQTDHVRGKLKRWFWSSCSLQTYAQGANTQCVRDARQLLAWIRSEGEEPEAVARFNGVDEDSLCDARRRNEILLRALLCGIVSRGATDLLQRKRLSKNPEGVATLRLVPRKIGDSDAVVDYTVCSTQSEKILLGFSASALARKLSRTGFAEHLIPDSAFKNEDWARFRKERAVLAAALLNDLATGTQS